MKLGALLDRERVVVPLGGDTLREAARELIDAVVRSGMARDSTKLEALVADPFPKGIVSVGGQAFLLHFRTDAVSRLGVALGVSRESVRREHDSTRLAKVVVMIVAPRPEVGTFLQVAGAFGRVMSRSEIAEGLIAAKTPEDVLNLKSLTEIELPETLTVHDLMRQPVRSIRGDATLAEAARVMIAHDISALPVVSETGEVTGMLSYRELLRHVLPSYVRRVSGEVQVRPRTVADRASSQHPEDAVVREAMSRSVLCVSEDQTLADIATVMVKKDVDYLPVVREGVLVGSLTRGDLVRRLFGP